MKTGFGLMIIAFLGLVSGCTTASGPNAEFERLADNYVESLLELNPQYATYLGDHRYDDRLTSYDKETRKKIVELYRAYRDTLSEINVPGLNDTNYVDYQILMHHIDYALFRYEELRSDEWNPLRYNPGGAIYSLLVRDFAPLEERLVSVKGRLEAIPQRLEEGRENLKNPPKIHTETAIGQFKGTLSMIESGMDEYIADAPDSSREMLKPAREKAAEALRDYIAWMEDDLMERSDGEFRLGKEKYEKKLAFALNSAFTAEELLERAETELVETQERLYQTSLPLYEKYFPKEAANKKNLDKKTVIKKVLDRMAEDNPTAENIVSKAKETLTECTEFVKEHDIVTVPDKPIDIIVMPEFQRGVAVAYCSSPGPLEEEGETFYAISPPPSDWSEDKVESYFREYNNYMLNNLTIHEAMPGHYLQGAHANEFEAPTKIRAIFGSGTFAEGWATYAEQVMIANGYGGPEVKAQMLKMRLRMIINAIIDQKIHTMGMTEDEAMDLMIGEGFQEKGEAAGKWRRACLSSAQLSTYYCGNIEINDIRKAAEEKWGETFTQKKFHDRLLSYGSPPPKYARDMMEL